MIALIALAAFALVAGVVAGTIALIVVIVKGIVGATRRKPATAPNSPTADADATDREFQRMVAQEWTSD